MRYLLCILLIALSACSRAVEESVAIQQPLRRIVSLSPSITKSIIDLESEDTIMGVTTWHPVMGKKVHIVGTLVTPNFERIVILQPDAVLYSEEDKGVQNMERLRSLGMASFQFKRNRDFDTICDNYIILGRMLGKEKLAREKIRNYRRLLQGIRDGAGVISPSRGINTMEPKVAFFVSHQPLIAASGRSFVGRIINDAGGSNIYENVARSYPIVSIESLVKLNPDIIISMSSDSAQFFRDILRDLDVPAVQRGAIYPIKPDNIALYTPGDYIKAARDIANIVKEGKGMDN